MSAIHAAICVGVGVDLQGSNTAMCRRSRLIDKGSAIVRVLVTTNVVNEPLHEEKLAIGALIVAQG